MCAQQETLLPLCYLSPVRVTSLPACRCNRVFGDRRGSPAGISIFLSEHYQCDFDGHEIVFDNWVEEQSVHPAL